MAGRPAVAWPTVKRRQQKKLSRHLCEATLSGDAARVRALLRAGADPERRYGDGSTPLYFASVQGEAEVARLLMEAGAAPDTESGEDGSQGTPLCAAACWGHTGTVRELLAHGADPNLREDHGTGLSPLEWAEHGPPPGPPDCSRQRERSPRGDRPTAHGPVVDPLPPCADEGVTSSPSATRASRALHR